VEITLRRMVMYHLTNTYLPTLTLLIISELTLFFNESHLQVALGFSLTIMLVMYTMYQGSSQWLPKTAFLMFIDYWLIFCLIVPFVVFLIEISWEFDHTKKLERASKILSCKQKKIRIPYQGLVQLIVLGATSAFILIYFSLAIFHYQSFVFKV
jgi:hypothetical protein